MSRRFLLISPPWRSPDTGCLALATLPELLGRQGIVTDTLYATPLFPRTPTDPGFLDLHGAVLFAPYLTPERPIDAEAMAWSVVARLTRERRMGGGLFSAPSPEGEAPPTSAREAAARLGLDCAPALSNLAADIARAGVCLDRTFARAARPEVDVVGFSCTFETQIPAAVVLARRLKAWNPALKVIFGGAACFEEQADGLAATFSEIDAVCHAEGELVIGPLIRALRDGTPLDEIPGVTHRNANGEVIHNPPPELFRDMDDLPMPDYDGFYGQLRGSDWGDLETKLVFETSRGCWWGQKSWCTFCGLNPTGMGFRSKSPARAYQEIEFLYRRYPAALQAADNILDMGYFKTLLPELAALPRIEGRPLNLFYEVKSNLNRDQVGQLAAAGITDLQPGIESFSDDVLTLMRKGATGIAQVQFLKWAHEHGVRPLYNILIQNPGEKAEWYREMAALIPFVEHLPPPTAITPMILQRFSPYFQHPESYGIRSVRPNPYYRHIYGDAADVDRLAYNYDYDHDMFADPEVSQAVREFGRRVLAWTSRRNRNRAFCVEREGDLQVVDRRHGDERVDVISGEAARVYRYLDKARPTDAVMREFGGSDPSALSTLLDAWVHRRWVYRDPKGRCLAVLPMVRPVSDA